MASGALGVWMRRPSSLDDRWLSGVGGMDARAEAVSRWAASPGVDGGVSGSGCERGERGTERSQHDGDACSRAAAVGAGILQSPT